LLALLVGAAIYDVRYRRIPNWLTVTGVLVGMLINFLIGPPEGGLIFALKGLAAGFFVYIVFYAIRAMGAGDVKLMAAVGALAGAERWFGIFFATALVGGAMAVTAILARRRTKKTLWNVAFILSELGQGRPAYAGNEELDVRSPRSFGLPHGAVIAISTVFYLAFSLHLSK